MWYKTHEMLTESITGKDLHFFLYQDLDSAPASVALLPVEKKGRFFEIDWQFSNERGEGVLTSNCKMPLVNTAENDIFRLLSFADPAKVQLRIEFDGVEVMRARPNNLALSARAIEDHFSFSIDFTHVIVDDMERRMTEIIGDLNNTDATGGVVETGDLCVFGNMITRYLFRYFFENDDGTLNMPIGFDHLRHIAGLKLSRSIFADGDITYTARRIRSSYRWYKSEFYAEQTGRNLEDLSGVDIVSYLSKMFFCCLGHSITYDCLVARELDCDSLIPGRKEYALRATTTNEWFDNREYIAEDRTEGIPAVNNISGNQIIMPNREISFLPPLQEYSLKSLFHNIYNLSTRERQDDQFKVYRFNNADDYDYNVSVTKTYFFYQDNRILPLRRYFDTWDRSLLMVSEIGPWDTLATTLDNEYMLSYLTESASGPTGANAIPALWVNPRQTDGAPLFPDGRFYSDDLDNPAHAPGNNTMPTVVSSALCAWALWQFFRARVKISIRGLIDPMYLVHYNNSRWIPVKGKWNLYEDLTKDLEMYNCDTYIHPGQFRALDGTLYAAFDSAPPAS